MLRWAPYPFIRITLSFIAGILLYFITGKEFSYTAEFFACFFVLFTAAVLFARYTQATVANNLAGILGLICFCTAGLLLAHRHDERKKPSHLSELNGIPAYYTGTVSDYVLQKVGYQSTVLEVEQVFVNGLWKQASGKVQLSVPDDADTAYVLSYGDQLLIKGAPLPVAPSLNPYQFDYQAFLANKNIYHRHYLQAHQYQKAGFAPPNSLLNYSIQLRRKLDAMLREHVPEKREYGISSALVLGVKDEVDNTIRDAYAGTGTMHVLAVSGLHVGLIYVLLVALLGRFKSSVRQRIAVAAIMLSVLWLYAFMTGLSPSVLRAVVMFSIVAVAGAISRRHNIYNTIAFAAFVLLWFNPFYLLEVSFQLSFLAVLGIVYLQPRLESILQFDIKILNKMWELFTVSVAAQLATLPLGIYYFHQFPVYFWLANLFVVPAASLVLYFGVAALTLSWLPFVGSLLFKIHSSLIWLMNEFNLLLTDLPKAIINGLMISQQQAWLMYAFLFLLVLFFASKRLGFLVGATFVVAILSVQQVMKGVRQQHQQVFAVYHLRGNTAVAFIEGRAATLFGSTQLEARNSDYSFNIRPHLWQAGIQEPTTFGLFSQPDKFANTILPDSNMLIVWNNFKIYVLSRAPQYLPVDSSQFDYLVLSQNVKLKSADLKKMKFKKAILDSSIAPWHAKRLEKLLGEEGVSLHNVSTEGAFILDIK